MSAVAMIPRMGDLVRVRKGLMHEGIELYVSVVVRAPDGERLVGRGLLRFRESDVEVVERPDPLWMQGSEFEPAREEP